MMKKRIFICLSLCLFALQNAKAEKKPWRERVGYDLVDTGFYWELNSGVLTISGRGPMPSSYGPWDGIRSPGKDAVYKVVIEQGVTNVSADIFAKHRNLKSVILPTSITSIGIHAFSECKNLQSIVIPNSVTTIPKWAFSLCSSLESVTIPNSITSIEEGAFLACKSLNHVTIPSSVVSIGRSAFSSCQSLESVTIPSSVKSSLDDVFSRENGPILLFKTIVINDKNYFLVLEENTIPLGDHLVRREKKYGLKDNTGKWIIPLSADYSSMEYFVDNFVKVAIQNKYGIVTLDGKELVPPELDAIEKCGKGFLRYKLNGSWGVMNYQGKIIIDTDRGYTSIGDFKSFNKRFAYTMNGYKGECDATGRQISKIKVDTPRQSTSVASSSSSSSSASNSNSNNASTTGGTQTIVVEHQHQPVPVQEWHACIGCGGMGTMGCDFCGGSGTRYVGDNLRRCSRCNGRGIIPCNVCYGHKGQYVTVYK